MPNLKTATIRTVKKFCQRLNWRFVENPPIRCRIFCTTLLVAASLATTFLAPPCRAEGLATSTVIEYHLDIDLHPDEQSLAAMVRIELPPTARPLALRLTPDADVSFVAIDTVPQAFTFHGGTLSIPALLASRNKPSQLLIRYRARFADPLPVDTVGNEDPSFGVGATISTAGIYLSAGTPWFPQTVGYRGRHRVRVSAPAGIIAVTAGRLKETGTRGNRTVTTWENDSPLDGLALSAGQFEVARDQLDDIQLLTFLSPENAALAPGYLSAMRRHLAFYRDLIGPYPYPKFAVVENFLPTGYGMPSWTLLGKSVVRLPFILDTSLPHEIVHSWWGNAVTVDYARGNWAEGLTTYLADYLLKERDHPAEALEYRRKILRDYASLVTPQIDFPLQDFRGRMAKYQQAVGYGKGAMVFHMLRQSVGETAFRQALQRMAAEGSGKALGWNDIERIFQDVAGMDLRWFFAQWVGQKGAPELSLDEVRPVRTATGWAVSGVVRQSGRHYRLDLPMRLTASNGETLVRNLTLTGQRTPFRFETAATPAALEADPQYDLFRRLSASELPGTINDLLTPQRPLVVVADGQQGLHAAARDLLKGLHWEGVEVADESTLDPAILIDRDLLLLGWPRRPELQPSRPGGLTITTHGGTTHWNIEGEPTRGDTLFAVLAGRNNPGGVRVLLLSGTPEAARQAVAKIVHYGRYSLLLFDAGRNVVKSTWEPQTSPLKITFPKELSP